MPVNARTPSRLRSRNGNMIVLTVSTVAGIMVPVVMLLTWGPHLIWGARAQTVVEAAGLVAAKDLSRIVINDADFGYVSLSNYPPIGKATIAPDGEPLPVTGINTLIGTVRQNAILADRLQNDAMTALVDKDADNLKDTLHELNFKLSDALQDRTRKGQNVDINGVAVKPLADVEAFLKANLPAGLKLKSVKLTLGWLDGGSETTVSIPQPALLAQVPEKEAKSGKYLAFKNYPVAGKDFSFAGVDSRTRAVASANFRPDDGKHVCSIVQIECTLISDKQPDKPIECLACCQPFSQPDLATRGGMTVRFSGRPVPGMLSWNDFLTKRYFQDNRLTTYDVIDGDYPFDRRSRMTESWHEPDDGTAQQFGEHLYCWLRNGRTTPRLDSVLAMIHEPFRYTANEVYSYEFSDDGTISRRIIDGTKFARPVAAAGQGAAMADTFIHSGAAAIVFFRDNVRILGVEESEHAGQPLAGYPLGPVDGMLDYDQLAQNFSKRAAINKGLAVDIEIGGTADSTARADVDSMRRRTANRRI